MTKKQPECPKKGFLFCFVLFFCIKKYHYARHQWLTPVILATQEAEIRRIMV
jgi:hypothetical protein